MDIDIRDGNALDTIPSKGSTQNSYTLDYGGGGVFDIIDGDSIFVTAQNRRDSTLVKRVLLGRALGYLLHQRGEFTLHASAISIDGRGVVFAGSRGAGKSTLAAAFLAAGHDVLACDISLIDLEDDPTIIPGFPLLKLSREAKDALVPTLDPVMPPVDEVEKRYYDIESAFVDSPVPLERVYSIEVDPEQAGQIRSFDPQQGVLELVSQSYAKPILEETGTVERNFQQCTTVAGSVPVKRLFRPDSFDGLSNVVEAVENDLEA